MKISIISKNSYIQEVNKYHLKLEKSNEIEVYYTEFVNNGVVDSFRIEDNKRGLVIDWETIQEVKTFVRNIQKDKI